MIYTSNKIIIEKTGYFCEVILVPVIGSDSKN